MSETGRQFLFLQGPHGPFFQSLSRALARAGVRSIRVAFNGGDRLFWRDRRTLIRYDGPSDGWDAWLERLLDAEAVTDIVLYGDVRPVHATAISIAKARGITVHVFEEGYLRPYWVTYERGGANGNSPLVDISIDRMARALSATSGEIAEVPAHWGDMRHHVFYGALYHAAVMAGGPPGVPTHRSIPVSREFRLHLRRLVMMPAHAIERAFATARILRGGFPYHLALLQLEHDANFRAWSPFPSTEAFVDAVVESFAQGAPSHHHLVFKAHPLEDGRVPLRRLIRSAARDRGVAARVHFVRGGKLARLLDHATSAVTVNSTSAQQALWRRLPLKCFGKAVYDKPELVSDAALPAFFAGASPPDAEAYRVFRRFLLETSQISGGFYSAQSRRLLLRRIVDHMLLPSDPYQRLLVGDAAEPQQLRLVH